jgi:hypothetical protein
MRPFSTIIALVIATSAPAAEIKPVDPSKPLFRILRFQKIEPGRQRPLGAVDDQPLLVVWSVTDLVLARDQKGVLITLTPKDAKAFAEITRKYSGVYLCSTRAKVTRLRLCTLLRRLQTVSSVSSILTTQPLRNICAAVFASASSNEV